jgi:hypothetical protein
MRSVVFTDPLENFILEKKDGYTVQKKLTELEGKMSHWTEEGQKDSGFYFVVCKDYDNSIKIFNSKRDKKIHKVLRNVEPGMLWIFDMKVTVSEADLEDYEKVEIRILLLRDDEFIMDYITFD